MEEQTPRLKKRFLWSVSMENGIATLHRILSYTTNSRIMKTTKTKKTRTNGIIWISPNFRSRSAILESVGFIYMAHATWQCQKSYHAIQHVAFLANSPPRRFFTPVSFRAPEQFMPSATV